jgi:hypothetical protein
VVSFKHIIIANGVEIAEPFFFFGREFRVFIATT